MSIAILVEKRYGLRWKNALSEQLPDVKIFQVGESEEALQAEFLICWKPKQNQLQEFPNLKVVQSLGAGVDHIFDTNVVPDHIQVIRMIDKQLAEDMWEYLLATALYCIRGFELYKQQQNQHLWKQHRYSNIANTTLSILGLGQIGAYAAQQFSKLGFTVKGWSKTEKTIKGVESFAGDSAFPDCLKDTQILINLLPLTPATQGILNQKNLIHLPKGAFLINAGRGGHQVEADILNLLEVGHLKGAILDVFEQEPLPKEHPFWKHPKIMITPHIASITNIQSTVNQVVENYRRMKKGLDLLNTVDVRKGY